MIARLSAGLMVVSSLSGPVPERPSPPVRTATLAYEVEDGMFTVVDTWRAPAWRRVPSKPARPSPLGPVLFERLFAAVWAGWS